MEIKEKTSRRDFLKSTALALTGTGLVDLISNESEAHPPSIQGQRNYFNTPLYFGPHHSHNHHIYTHSHHNNSSPYLGLYIMDASLRAMFWGNLIRQQAIEDQRLRAQNPNYDSYDCRIRIEEPMNLPQTFIANGYQDFNRNGYVDFPDEFVGIGKTKFSADESIAIGLRLPLGRISADKKVETRLYKVLPNKDKKLVDRNERIMSNDNVWRNFRNGNIARNNGTGNYEAEFYFDRKHWNTIPFEIVDENSRYSDSPPDNRNLPQTFIANSYQDFNKDGHVSFPQEFLGIGKTKFNEDESITVGLRLPSGRMLADKKIETRLYKKISDERRRLVDKKEIITSYGHAWGLARSNETGNYEVEFYFDNRYLNTIPFEIIPENSRYSDSPPDNRKVIVEPLGVFEKNAPKPY